MDKPDIERRMYKRVPIMVELRYLLPLDTFEKVYTASTFDMGKGGIGLASDTPLREGAAMIVELDPRKCEVDQEIIRLQAQCIWCEPKDDRYHMGVMFYFFDEELRLEVAKFVDALDQFSVLGR